MKKLQENKINFKIFCSHTGALKHSICSLQKEKAYPHPKWVLGSALCGAEARGELWSSGVFYTVSHPLTSSWWGQASDKILQQLPQEGPQGPSCANLSFNWSWSRGSETVWLSSSGHHRRWMAKLESISGALFLIQSYPLGCLFTPLSLSQPQQYPPAKWGQ